ncbi:aldo/keto reductase [Labrys monachus]|uniref:D-threo-aldose 1-dehydrogenase n=1 Tax=Labrys monachus TaxID=217067 RepID=A0ABU0FFP8_9HYPH|nr:aldo/keto reductase [Labrys monachus]MDQ0393428.1 D-threo-aldose 1-dehydrogenase [Labrys monachus]
MTFAKRVIGNGCAVPALGFGTAPLGGLYAPVSPEDAAATLELAWARGVRFFDTAPQYGNGLSERHLGAFLAAKPREDFVLATKVGRLLRVPAGAQGEDAYYKGTPPERPVFDFSYDGVMRSVEESLARLKLARVDILHIHDPDDHYEAAISGAYKALDALRSQGVIKAVGAGMNQWQMLARFAQDGVFDCFLLAGRYTLLDQSALAEFLPLCQARNIAVFAAGVYNSGILADPRAGAKFNYDDAPTPLVEKALRIEAVCRRHGVPLRAAAMQFPSAHPAVVSTLTGARNPAELGDNLDMAETSIPSALWSDLVEEGLIPAEAPLPQTRFQS